MTNTSTALLTGLLAGGFGVIGTAGGVALGYYLTERSEKKKRLESETREIYDRLLKLKARLELLLLLGSSLPQASGIPNIEYEKEMAETAIELSILASKGGLFSRDRRCYNG